MDKFNLKQFINENNLGAYSKLKEDEVEEGVADFNYAAAKAKLAGKSEFDFEGKNYKVTMSQAAAEKIVGKADANEEKTLPAAIAKAEKDQIEKDAMKSKGMVKEATDAEVIEILSDMLLKLSDGNTTARYAACEVAKEQGVSFNLVLQKYQAKGGSLQDIDFETLKEGDLDQESLTGATDAADSMDANWTPDDERGICCSSDGEESTHATRGATRAVVPCNAPIAAKRAT